MISYAEIKDDFEKSILDNGFLFWLPMVRVRYKSGFRKHNYLFDGFISPSLGKLDLYVILLRNPSHVKIVHAEDVPIGEINIQPLRNGEEIMEELKQFRIELTDKLSEAYDEISISDAKMAIASMLWFISPDSIAQYDTESQYYNMLMTATNLLEKIGVKKKSNIKILEEEVVYYPILISKDRETVYEPALKNEKSESLTSILKIPEIKELIFTQIL